MSTERVALVTGAARGIGAAVARRLSRDGTTVLLTDIRDAEGERTAADIGGRAEYERLDVRREADWVRVCERLLDRHGRLDVLVNNAGITGFENGPAPHDPENAALEDWQSVHRTNLDGVFLGCKHGIRTMRRRGAGSIINISSRSGLVGIPGAAAYASSKAAVRNHTKTVALYCAAEGLAVRCNAVFPAAILTPMWDAMLGEGSEREARMQELVRDVPLKRFGTADEVAAVVAYLASDDAAYTTGAELVIDGGLLAGAPSAPER
ncbi:MAG: glucose 1-dehydrogenase [Gemmatimonadetes bacterium]|nr:glucose 1-dehydrogenase [Gemmatimonadota bacterium]